MFCRVRRRVAAAGYAYESYDDSYEDSFDCGLQQGPELTPWVSGSGFRVSGLGFRV